MDWDDVKFYGGILAFAIAVITLFGGLIYAVDRDIKQSNARFTRNCEDLGGRAIIGNTNFCIKDSKVLFQDN